MGNIFTDLVAKLTRRQRKGKPVPVPVPVTPKPAPEAPLRAVTYNRVNGVVSGGVIQAGNINGRVRWDDEARVYKGTNYITQSRNAEEARRRRERDDYDNGNDFNMFVAGTAFDDTFFYQNNDVAPERPCEDSNYSGGYTDTSSGSSSSYEAPSPSYSAPETSYSPPSYSSDYGSSSSTSSYDSGSSSSYDSGSSGGGSYGD